MTTRSHLARLARCILLAATAIAAVLALPASPASALDKHVLSFSFSGSGPEALSQPKAVAVDEATQDIYVIDPANHRVEKFNSSGTFLLMFGKEVDATTHGNVCPENSGDVCQAGVTGSTPGAFVSPDTLAVDNSTGPSQGDVYVGDDEDGLTTKFDSVGHVVASWNNAGQLGPNLLFGVAVDDAGNLFEGFLGPGGFPAPAFLKFTQDGSFLREWGSGLGLALSRAGLEIDSEENAYLATGGQDCIDKFSPTGELVGAFSACGANGFAIDPAADDLYVAENGGAQVGIYNAGCAACAPRETFGAATLNNAHGVTISNSLNREYVADTGNHRVDVFTSIHFLPDLTAAANSPGSTTVTLTGEVDPAGAGPVTGCKFEYGTTNTYAAGSIPCAPAASLGSPFTTTTPVSANLTGLLPATTYHFRLSAENANGTNASVDHTVTTNPSAPAISAENVGEVHGDSVHVHAQINPGGLDTTYRVEYGTDETYGSVAPVPAAELGSSTTPRPISVPLAGLVPATTYHYRVLADNLIGEEAGSDQTFVTFPFLAVLNDACPNALARQQTGAALLLDCRAYELVSASNSGGYDVESDIVPGQAPYGGYPQASGAAGASRVLYGIHSGAIPGVAGNPTNRGVDPYVATRGEAGWSTAYVGVPANNPFAAGPFSSMPSGADASLQAFAFGGSGGCSPCFEGGYTGIPLSLPNGELVQGMVAGQGVPAPGPSAESDGHIAKDLSADGSHFVFGSTSLFAPGGNDETGDVSIYDRNLKTGETHVVSNTHVTEDIPVPLSCLQGTGKCNSAEGDANGISELDISNDGSRILLGQKVSEDSAGNPYYHLYMVVADAIASIDITPGVISEPGGPGFSEGVLYDGMSADGSKVFFTSPDRMLPGDDTDLSVDLYAAEVSGQSATLHLVSTGAEGAGNTNSCDPVGNTGGAHWNALGAEKGCGAVAIGGGGGVASQSGALYFLSPEKLSEPGVTCGIPCSGQEPIQDQPNLYLAAPRSSPRFIATLDPNDPLVLDALAAPATRHTADFQVTPDGNFAVFTSTRSLTEYEGDGYAEVYRYASGQGLDCVSCDPTNARPTGDATLASVGSSLSDDGRVFFNSNDPLVLRDTDNRKDAYEWETIGGGECRSESPNFFNATGDCLSLISAGSSPFDSSLLGASADGTDAFFFTHDSLARQDRNGPVTKVYDARTGGGFFEVPEPPLCAASDECHGPSSRAPGPPEIRTATGSPETYVPPPPCKHGFLRKHGNCAKKPRPHKPKPHKRAGHRQRGGSK